jgi:hypothetical protein
MLADGRRPCSASLQWRHQSDASSRQIGVSGFRRTSLTAVRSTSECVLPLGKVELLNGLRLGLRDVSQAFLLLHLGPQ